jgi:hypothetical protein
MREAYNEWSSELPAHKDPAKKTYFVKDDKIKVIFHLEDGRIIPSFREFKKPNTDQKANSLETPISFEVKLMHRKNKLYVEVN